MSRHACISRRAALRTPTVRLCLRPLNKFIALLIAGTAGPRLRGRRTRVDQIDVTAPAGRQAKSDPTSEVTVGKAQLEHRPIVRAGEVLEAIPGLLVTQHSGAGSCEYSLELPTITITPLTPTRLTYAIANVATTLHVYVALFKADGGASLFLVGLFLISTLPYAIAAGIAYVEARAVFGLGFAAASLAGDLFMHYAVFIAPKGSTAALGLLFMPIWNLLILGPIGGIIFWLVHRLLFKHRA